MAKTNQIVATKALANKIARACYYVMRDREVFKVEKVFGRREGCGSEPRKGLVKSHGHKSQKVCEIVFVWTWYGTEDFLVHFRRKGKVHILP